MIPKYVKDYLKNKKPLVNSAEEYLSNHKEELHKILPYCRCSKTARSIIESFAKDYRYGVIPDKLVCFRLIINTEEESGELGLTYIAMGRYWEFYASGLSKNSKRVVEFRDYLLNKGYKLKMI